MNSHILLFLAILLPSLTSNTSSEKVVKDYIVSQGKQRTYYLYVPDTVKASSPAPLIVLLHGSGHNGMSLIEKWKDLAKQEGVIIVGPDSINSAQWSSPVDGPDFLHDLVEALKAKYPVNPRRVYLFGHSGGAIFALQVALLESEYFAAVAVHAGALQSKAYSLIDHARRKINIAIFVGTKDQYFPLTAVRATRDELEKKGFSVEVTEIPDHDHWYYDLAPKINRSAWDFLKKHELAEDQQYEEYTFKK